MSATPSSSGCVGAKVTTYPRAIYMDWTTRRRRRFPHEFRIVLNADECSLCCIHRTDELDAIEREWYEWCRRFVGNPAIKRPLWGRTGTYALGFKRSEHALMFKLKFL